MFFKNSNEMKSVLKESEECVEHGFYLMVKKQQCLDFSRYLIGTSDLTYEDIKELLNLGAVLYVKKINKENEYEEVDWDNIESDFIKYFGHLTTCLDQKYYVFDVFVTEYKDLEILINWILQKKIEGEEDGKEIESGN